MSIFRTIALFVYLFGYMIVHYSVLCKAERALAAGDTETVRQLVKKHIPHWSKGILNVTGVRLSVEGLDNIPKDGPCVFVANHRSYYDIPLLLAGLDEPYGILAKEELGKIPLLNRWMKLLAANGAAFVSAGFKIFRVCAEHHVSQIPVPIPHHDFVDSRAIVQHRHIFPVTVGNGIAGYRPPIGQLAEKFLFDHTVHPIRSSSFS